MYESMFNPDVFTISVAIYVLMAACLLLALKLRKAERGNRKHMEYILFLHDRLTKLSEAESKAVDESRLP